MPTRNIKGEFGYGGAYGLFKSDAMSGAFYSGETVSRTFGEGKGSADHGKFDASRVVPTASENRPYSIYALPLISY